MRPTAQNPDFSRFYSQPAARSEDIAGLMAEIERKRKLNEEQSVDEAGNEEVVNEKSQEKWFYVSNSRVTEVKWDKVMRSQAYILLYERKL